MIGLLEPKIETNQVGSNVATCKVEPQLKFGWIWLHLKFGRIRQNQPWSKFGRIRTSHPWLKLDRNYPSKPKTKFNQICLSRTRTKSVWICHSQRRPKFDHWPSHHNQNLTKFKWVDHNQNLVKFSYIWRINHDWNLIKFDWDDHDQNLVEFDKTNPNKKLAKLGWVSLSLNSTKSILIQIWPNST